MSEIKPKVIMEEMDESEDKISEQQEDIELNLDSPYELSEGDSSQQ